VTLFPTLSCVYNYQPISSRLAKNVTNHDLPNQSYTLLPDLSTGMCFGTVSILQWRKNKTSRCIDRASFICNSGICKAITCKRKTKPSYISSNQRHT